MIPQQRPYRYIHLLSILTPVILATGLAFVLFRSPSLVYAISDSEYNSVLFAQGYFQALTQGVLLSNALPFQNINLLTSSLVWLGSWIPITKTVLLWISLSVLGTWFIYRSTRLYLLVVNEAWYFYTPLLLIHPFWGGTLVHHPSEMITALLAMELIIQTIQKDRFTFLDLGILFLLSLSGCTGFFAALIFTFLMPFILPDRPFPFHQNLYQRLGWIGSALLPAGLLYLLLSLQWGVMGGVYMPDYPTLFSEFSIDKLWTSEWTQHASQAVQWMANGFLHVPIRFPIFGLVVLIGFIEGYQSEGMKKKFNHLLMCMAAIQISVVSFAPMEVSASWYILLYPLALCSVFQGLNWFQRNFNVPRSFLYIVFTAMVSIAAFLFTPSEWNPSYERARYYRNICHTLRKEVLSSIHPPPSSLAIRFHPAVFVLTGIGPNVYPIDHSIVAEISTPYGKQGGVHFDLCFASAPETIVLFPFLRSLKDATGRERDTLLSPWQGILAQHYHESHLYNLSIYKRKTDDQQVFNQWLFQAFREGPHGEAYSLMQKFDSKRSPLSMSGAALKKYFPHPVGMMWDFETDYSHTHQTGFAFGTVPLPQGSVAGIRSAGSGNRFSIRKQGILESDPFVIEGDRLSFYANIPSDSTASLFCLAIYDQVPFGKGHRVQKARHIFDHQMNEPLMQDTFFYIRPSQLTYPPGRIKGWRVVYMIQQSSKPGWVKYSWPLVPWTNKQAVWLAADRDRNHFIQIDQIIQWKSPGKYESFEDGTYDGWQTQGTAFGERPAMGAIKNQQPITGYTGNYFINSYHQGSDQSIGTLQSKPFQLQWNRLQFRIGGGNDPENLYVGLRVHQQLVKQETGRDSESLRLVTWDVTPWMGETVQIEIADLSSHQWGHILVDDIDLYQEPVFQAFH